MTRLLKALGLLLFVTSCKTDVKKEVVDKLLIFGYSGFCFKDSLNHVYPSDERWYNDSFKLELDSTRLDIRQYFEFKKDSFIRIARRQPRQQTEFLSVRINDTLGLDSLINRVLLFSNYKTDYSFKEPTMYDGWSYTLYYKTSNQEQHLIHYIPDLLPDSLRVLHDYITKMIASNSHRISSNFEFSRTTMKEAKELYNKYPPPPRPTKPLLKVKFTATANNDSIKNENK